MASQSGLTGGMDRRQLLRMFGSAAALGVAGVGAAACNSAPSGNPMAQPNGQTINVALVTSTQSLFKQIGDDISTGFQLFLTANEQLLGLYRVNLLKVDENDTKAMGALPTQGMTAIVGVANPDMLKTLAPAVIAVENPAVMLCPSSAPADTINMGTPWLWETAAPEGDAGRALATYALSLGGKAYVLVGDSPISVSESDAFKRAIQNVNNVQVGQIMDTATGTVSGKTVPDALSSHANAIFAAHIGEMASSLLNTFQAANNANLNPTPIPLIGPGSLTESIDLTKLPQLPSNVYTASFYAPDLDNEANRQFLSAYANQGSAPSSVVLAAYDAAALLDRALMQIQSDLTTQKLNNAIKGLGQIQSPRGNWTFNSLRSPQQNWYLRKLRLDGQVPANLLDRDLGVFGTGS
jgi:branched-chain amino acid transport system substrate-binding protein